MPHVESAAGARSHDGTGEALSTCPIPDSRFPIPDARIRHALILRGPRLPTGCLPQQRTGVRHRTVSGLRPQLRFTAHPSLLPNTMRPASRILLLSLIVHASAHAGTLSVTTTADAGPGSLRAAIEQANAGDAGVIEFSESFPLEGIINLSSPLPAFTAGEVELRGGERFPRVDGGGLHQIFRVGPGTTRLSLSDMVLRSGRGGVDEAGCIHSQGGSEGELHLERVDFHQCRIEQNGLSWGGAIRWSRTQGSVTVSDAIFFQNQAVATGTNGQAAGGAIYSQSPVHIRRSIFLANSSSTIEGLSLAGALYLIGDRQSLIEDSVFTGNSTYPSGSAGAGGAIQLACFDCTLRITRSAFRGNASVTGAAIHSFSNQFGGRPLLVLTNASFFNNSAGSQGGGLWLGNTDLELVNNSFHNSSADEGAHIYVLSGVAADRIHANLMGPTFSGNACSGQSVAVVSSASNYLHDASCTSFDLNALPGGPLGSIVYDETPGLVPVLRFDGSAVVDAIADASLCEPEDARGTPRPQDGNDDGIARCDVGAFESPGPLIFASSFES
jgi:hypothetical protein